MFVNLQRYPINLYREDGTILHIPPSDNSPHIFEKLVKDVDLKDQVPVYQAASSEVLGLQPIEPEHTYIASIAVATLLKLPNVLSPINAVRNNSGNIIGFRGLKRWI